MRLGARAEAGDSWKCGIPSCGPAPVPGRRVSSGLPRLSPFELGSKALKA